jgi:hypothetical protein
MNNIRKWFGLVAAIVVGAFAMPVLAQNVKYITLGAPTSVSVSATSVQVTFKNVDNGNSSFNSIGIKGTASGGATITINSGSASPGGPGTPATTGDGYYYLTGISPVKKGQTLTVTLNVTIAGSGCSAGKITWHGRAFTGSPSQPSTEFQQQNLDPETTVNKNCSYSYTITDKIYKGDKDKTLTATVSNPAGSNASIGAISLTPPSGITASSFTPSGFPITAGNSGTVDITASAPCDSSGSGGAWTSAVTDFTLSGGEKSTAVKGNCVLGFVAPPSSIVPGESFNVTIKLYNDDSGSTITTFTGNVTVVVDGSGCTVSGDPTLAAVLGVATLNVTLNADATATTCSIKAKTTIGSTDLYSAKLTLTVFDGVLGCTPTTYDALNLLTTVPTGAGAFDASEGGASGPGDIAYVAGMRGYGDDKSGGCTLINYAVYNNIPIANTSTQTDPLGNKVPPGYFSITWDTNQAPNPVVAVVTTFRSEWGDAATGLPTRKTLVCTAFPCPGDPTTYPTAWKPAPSCLDSLVVHASVPAGEAACLVAEKWEVVPVGDPEYCTTTPPAAPPGAPVGWQPRCLQATTISIVGKDPVFGR